MPPETPILECEQKRKIGRAYILRSSIKTPTPVGRGEGTQELPVAVENEARRRCRYLQGQRVEKLERRCAKHNESKNEGAANEPFVGFTLTHSRLTPSRNAAGIIPEFQQIGMSSEHVQEPVRGNHDVKPRVIAY